MWERLQVKHFSNKNYYFSPAGFHRVNLTRAGAFYGIRKTTNYANGFLLSNKNERNKELKKIAIMFYGNGFASLFNVAGLSIDNMETLISEWDDKLNGIPVRWLPVRAKRDSITESLSEKKKRIARSVHLSNGTLLW